jgi:hypothetical protein
MRFAIRQSAFLSERIRAHGLMIPPNPNGFTTITAMYDML